MQKTISTLAIAGSIAFLGAGAAQAAEYPAPVVPGTVSNSVIVSGNTVVFGGSGFTSFENVNITIVYNGAPPAASGAAGAGRVGAARTGVIVLNQVLAPVQTKADANGNFSIPLTLGEPGSYTLTAVGAESGRTVTSVVTVVPASAPTGGNTGGNTGGTTPGGTTGGTTGETTGGTTAGGTTAGVKGGLANTGIEASMFLWGAAGIGALGLGAGSIVVARRRAGAEA